MKQVMRQVAELHKRYASAGIHEDAGIHNRDYTVADVGAINENGGTNSLGITVPPRPWMSDVAFSQQSSVASVMRDVAYEVVGGESDAKSGLQQIADDYAQRLVDSVVRWTSPPNAPATIEKKGFDDPLIETGRLRDSLKGTVRE